MKALKRSALIQSEISKVNIEYPDSIQLAVEESWGRIPTFWPLKNLVAINPLAGFESMAFADALQQASALFEQSEPPEGLLPVNRHTIKWLQVYFDEGQSIIRMPLKEKGLLQSVLELLLFDSSLKLTASDKEKLKGWTTKSHNSIIRECLFYLGIPSNSYSQFLLLLLSTLAGWAAHIQYQHGDSDDSCGYKEEFLALRLILCCLLWPEARELLKWYEEGLDKSDYRIRYAEMEQKERAFRERLLSSLPISLPEEKKETPDAQLVFCIDVRSEPIRRAIEAQGAYETFGAAGFFGVPVSIHDEVSEESHASCPVLIKPQSKVYLVSGEDSKYSKKNYDKFKTVKKLYQSLKYNFATPCSLVETMGGLSAGAVLLKTLAPQFSKSVKKAFDKTGAQPSREERINVDAIPVNLQCDYAENALRNIGLTDNFSSLVILCGHKSSTTNNPYASALDCGACGGRPGSHNARTLAIILNSKHVRSVLSERGINIPGDTEFLGAEHDTTTDEIFIFRDAETRNKEKLLNLKQDLLAAQLCNVQTRAREMGYNLSRAEALHETCRRSCDWAETRPEWGLAGNAAFIIGPRALTRDRNLEGRCFLQSYNFQDDPEGTTLAAILTAPMVVTQWINAQYLFSTLNNVAHGSGSKVTMNITGKVGVMQGNASDLMHGLPMQSVYSSDDTPYHESIRLTVVVYAPCKKIEPIIVEHQILKKLFGNGWINLVSIDPEKGERYLLNREFSWDTCGRGEKARH